MVQWRIGTFARIRPPRRGHQCGNFILDKLNNGHESAAIISFPPPDDDDDRPHLKQRDTARFQFNDIFDPSRSQDDVFNTVCLDIVRSAMNGFNGTIFAYGQTGSGKTYTITGGEQYADRGLIPRVLSCIYEEMEARVATTRFACFISYLEIYNESVYDLLDRAHTDRPIEEWTKVQLLDDDDGELHFRNLGVYEAVSEEEALNLLFLGNMNRVTSDTPMNQASSRSHSVFSVLLEARGLDSDVIVTSKLHLVDLAGSERVYKREGTQRIRTEGKHINLSLHHLEQVILSLRATPPSSTSTSSRRQHQQKQQPPPPPHVPYRNSMLTSVLRGSLGGNCKSVFIATLNPEREFVDESISTCRFMQRCAQVSVDVAVNSEVDMSKRVATLTAQKTALEITNRELGEQLARVEHDLQSARSTIAQMELEQQQRCLEEQAHVDATSSYNREPLGSVDWDRCEDLVERLLQTGDCPRDRLRLGQAVDYDEENGDGDDDTSRRMPTTPSKEEEEACRPYREVTRAIQRDGLLCALGCIVVLKESTLFASNTAVELQELMDRQRQTVELLESRLIAQKREAEQLKTQIREMLEMKEKQQEPRTGDGAGDGEGKTRLPRSRSHTGAVTVGSRPAHGRTPSSHSPDGGDGADSDSDMDSEAVTPPSPPQSPSTMSLVFAGTDAKEKTPQHIATATAATTIASLIPDSAAPVAPLPAPTRTTAIKPGRTEPAKNLHTIRPRATPPPSSSPLAAPASAGEVIRRRMDLLQKGGLFVKYGRYGRPHVRFVWCSPDLEYVNYRSISAQVAKASIPTRTMQRVLMGQTTKVFERARQQSREPFCFSVEYDETRTLDLEIMDGDNADHKTRKRDEWAEALQFLIKMKTTASQPIKAQDPSTSRTA